MAAPLWLPNELVLPAGYDTSIHAAWEAFDRCFGGGRCTVDNRAGAPTRVAGLRVEFDTNLVMVGSRNQEYADGFYHVCSQKDEMAGGRVWELDRASKVPWVAAVIENCSTAEVDTFDYEESTGDIRTYVRLLDPDFLVILERQDRPYKAPPIAFLKTAYPVTRNSTRRNLEQKQRKRK